MLVRVFSAGILLMANYHYDKNTEEGDPSTLTQQVYDTLREEILSGKLGPGYRLVRRKESDRLGVSRMAVTEALIRLEVDGFVESRPMYGSRVRPLTLEDVQGDEILREALECQSARMAAETASEEELTALIEKAIELDGFMTRPAMDSQEGMEAHSDFHYRLAAAGAGVRFAEELKRVWFRRLMRLNWIKAAIYRKVPERWHQNLIEVCLKRDIPAAEAMMREHVRYGCEHDIEALKVGMGKDLHQS